MHACIEIDCCLCVFVYVYVYVYVVGLFLTCLQGGAVYITGIGSKGTFENCNFTSNEAKDVSLEEEHVDGCV